MSPDNLRPAPAGGREMLFALAVIFTLQTAITALIVLAVGARGWDDGAITLAFSHTFADTGRIALNAASEQVEGFSSPSWFLLNALAAKFNLGFFGAVYCSQILTAVAFGLSTLFVVLLAGRLGLRFGTTLAIGVALSLFGPTLTEISNGMEMTLLSASSLALVYFLYFSRNSVLAMVAAAAFLLTRFEAAIYYAVMVIPLFFFGRTKTFVWFCLFGAAVVLLEEGVRYAIFSDVLPATIHAKSHFPYSKSGWLGVASHVISTLEFAIPVFPLLLAGGAVWVFGGRSVRAAQDFAMARRNELMALSAAVVAIELFAVVAGVNLGYLGRMEFAAFPFVFLLFGLVFDWFAAGFRPAARRVALIAALSAEVAFSWAISARTAVADIAMFVRRDPALEQPRIVTPGFFRGTGLAADHLRRALLFPGAGGGPRHADQRPVGRTRLCGVRGCDDDGAPGPDRGPQPLGEADGHLQSVGVRQKLSAHLSGRNAALCPQRPRSAAPGFRRRALVRPTGIRVPGPQPRRPPLRHRGGPRRRPSLLQRRQGPDRRPVGVSAWPGLGHLAACDDLADSVFRLCNPVLYGRVQREGQGDGVPL